MLRVLPVALALLSALPASAAPDCRMAPADKLWLDTALGRWRWAEAKLLKLPPAALPTIVTADADCTYAGHADRSGTLVWSGIRRSGPITMPDGKAVPLGPISFAAPDDGSANTGYFAMTLPSVWSTAGIKSALGLERLMQGVLLHELMHTRQFYFANPQLARLTKKFGLPDDIGDDSLQEHFTANPGYVAAYTAERDLLFQAAAAPTDTEARRLAGEALTAMQARRAKYFTGAEAKWLPLDDLFLDMEGLGQWLAYAAYAAEPGQDRAVLLKEVRRGGKFWTQDEGLALLLVVDRLVPGWQRLAFADPPLLAEALLVRAARPPAP